MISKAYLSIWITSVVIYYFQQTLLTPEHFQHFWSPQVHQPLTHEYDLSWALYFPTYSIPPPTLIELCHGFPPYGANYGALNL